MEISDIPISEWQPITNKHDLAVLGKLGEEASELCSAICRCIIQGMDGLEPTTGKPNRQWLEEEIADVMALVTLAIQEFNLDSAAISERCSRKIAYKFIWI